MEFVSSHWAFDPTSFVLDPSVGAMCDLRLDIPDDLSRELLAAGLWWIYPLGRTYASYLIGLRLVPGTLLRESPVVMADGAAVVTLCARPAVLVPTLMFGQMVAGEPHWGEVAALPNETWHAAVALHRALGGDDDLAALRAVAGDRVLAAAIADRDNYARWAHALTEARVRLDPGPEMAAYARYAVDVAVAKYTTASPPQAGCWNQALAALAFWGSRDERARTAAPELARALELNAAWRMLQGPPALDTSRSGPGLTLVPSARKTVEIGLAAAQLVATDPLPAWAGDPRLPAIEALAQAASYDGAAHLDAAAALVRRGDFAGAFDALTAAAHWSYHVSDRARPEALDAAVTLARQVGGADLVEALEQQRMANAAEAPEQLDRS